MIKKCRKNTKHFILHSFYQLQFNAAIFKFFFEFFLFSFTLSHVCECFKVSSETKKKKFFSTYFTRALQWIFHSISKQRQQPPSSFTRAGVTWKTSMWMEGSKLHHNIVSYYKTCKQRQADNSMLVNHF